MRKLAGDLIDGQIDKGRWADRTDDELTAAIVTLANEFEQVWLDTQRELDTARTRAALEVFADCASAPPGQECDHGPYMFCDRCATREDLVLHESDRG